MLVNQLKVSSELTSEEAPKRKETEVMSTNAMKTNAKRDYLHDFEPLSHS